MKPELSLLRQLLSSLPAFRTAVDALVSENHGSADEWRRSFHGVLLAATELYLGYLLVQKNEAALWKTARGRPAANARWGDIQRETALQHKITDRLESALPWKLFRTTNQFSRWTGLWDRRDYVERLALHLAEVYEQTIGTEKRVTDFLADRSPRAFADISVGLEHLGRNHISFVLQALQWAADESSWMEPHEAERRERIWRRPLEKRGQAKPPRTRTEPRAATSEAHADAGRREPARALR